MPKHTLVMDWGFPSRALIGGSDRSGYLQSAEHRQSAFGAEPWILGASIAAHVLALALALLIMVHPFETPPVRSIDVQIISDQQYRATIQTAAPVELATREPPVAPAPRLLAPVAPAPIQKSPVALPKVEPGDGMIRPSHLLAGGLLKEAASQDVRKTLPTLAPDERVTQLCNIETTEQIRTAYPKTFADAVIALAFAETIVAGFSLEAPGAAYRSKRHWYVVSFICNVASDYESVTDYRFKTGAEIPKNEWDSHNLLGEDDNE